MAKITFIIFAINCEFKRIEESPLGTLPDILVPFLDDTHDKECLCVTKREPERKRN